MEGVHRQRFECQIRYTFHQNMNFIIYCSTYSLLSYWFCPLLVTVYASNGMQVKFSTSFGDVFDKTDSQLDTRYRKWSIRASRQRIINIDQAIKQQT